MGGIKAVKYHAQLQLYGGFGVPSPPAFAFDLLGAAIAKSQGAGLQRYGRNPGAGNDDRRPLAPTYRRVFNPGWVSKGGVAVLVGGQNATKALLAVTSPFGGAAGLTFTDSRIENPHAFRLPITLGAGESLSFNAFVFPVSKDKDKDSSNGHVWHVRIGDASGGVLFQVRDGNAEVARMSENWTRGGEDQLRLLWALEEPTQGEQEQIESLKKSLYSTFESLSFERSVGRDNWIGGEFGITLIPEPRGALHVVLEGADASQIEFADLLAEEEPAPIWGDGAQVEVGATGGAWLLQPMMVRFNTASLKFGPYKNGYWADSWDNCEYAATAGAYRDDSNGDEPSYKSHVNFERVELNEVMFEFRAKFTTTDPRYCAWLYGLNARLPNGPRDSLGADVYFDSDDLYTPAGGGARETDPILDVQLSCDEGGGRSAEVKMRDVKGRTSMPANIDALIGRVATLNVGEQSYIKSGIVARGRASDMAGMAHSTGGGLRRLAIDVTRAESEMALTIDEGRQLLDEALCDPPPIGDGLHLGAQIRRCLRIPGFSTEEMARVPEDLGPILDRARAGEGWANCPDASSSAGNAIDGLLDRYGLGLRFYRDEDGVWVLERVPTDIKTAFTSSHAMNDPNLKRGGTRAMILSPLDWERDQANYHNAFRVEGALRPDGRPIFAEYLDRQSISGAQAGNARWLGRLKRYPTLRDSGMKKEGTVNYTLRSLRWRFGRPGLLAQFETYLNTRLRFLDRVTCDGVLCEVVSWQGSTAEDAMQLRVREIA